MRTTLLALSIVTGCGTNYGQASLAIESPPPKISTTSALEVPVECPIYAPGGGDVDTVEDAYAIPFAFGCGVAAPRGTETTTFGLVGGDAPTSQLPKLPGDREIGIYRELRPEYQIDRSKFIVTGDAPVVRAYLDQHNVCDNAFGNLPEDRETNRIPISVVALSESGFLISLGALGVDPAQVDVVIDFRKFVGGPEIKFWATDGDRFYLNRAPNAPTPVDQTCL